MGGERADQLVNDMIARIAGLPIGHPLKGKDPADVLIDANLWAMGANNAAVAVGKNVDALGLTMSKDDLDILTAVHNVQAPEPTDVAALVAALAPPLVAAVKEALPVDATPEQIAEAMVAAFAAHLGGAA